MPTAEELVLDIGEKTPIGIALGHMHSALKAIKACDDDLLRRWGADPAAMVKPSKDVFLYYSVEDYPAEALKARQSGTVAMMATIDTAGKPSRCSVVRSSDSPALDRRSCDILMRRATFSPAPQGPERRFFYTHVHWESP